MSALILIAITAVFLHGRIIDPNEEFTCDYPTAIKLIDGGSAKLKEEDDSPPTSDSVDPSDNVSTDSTQDDSQPPAPTDVEALTKQLDALTVDKLKALANKHEIMLEKDDKKAQIIAKIVAIEGFVYDEADV